MRKVSSAAVVVASTLISSTLVHCSAQAAILGTATVQNSIHHGYFAFASQTALNSKATIGPFTGNARMLTVTGTVTSLNSQAWLKSIQVKASGTNLAIGQPSVQFANLREFGTIQVSARVFIPTGLDLSKAINLEMYSLDDEEFVPGPDARSTLTYTFEDSLPAGTAEWSGRLQGGDLTFNRPQQFESFNSVTGPGYTQPFFLSPSHNPFFDVQSFYVDKAGTYTIASTTEFYTAGLLYRDTFNRLAPTTNLLRAVVQDVGNVFRPSDDFGNLTYAGDAEGGNTITFDLVPGVQYQYVTAAHAGIFQSFSEGPNQGRYTNIITGPGNAFLGNIVVPEPGTPALALVGLSALALRRRR